MFPAARAHSRPDRRRPWASPRDNCCTAMARHRRRSAKARRANSCKATARGPRRAGRRPPEPARSRVARNIRSASISRPGPRSIAPPVSRSTGRRLASAPTARRARSSIWGNLAGQSSTIVASTYAGQQTFTLPYGASDALLGQAATQTITNKTISGASNTITNVSLTIGRNGQSVDWRRRHGPDDSAPPPSTPSRR